MFYRKVGWRQDVTPPGVSQFTLPGSWCSVIFGKNLTPAAPGSGKGYLIVSDIAAAWDKLVVAGIEVSEIFHVGPNGPVSGPDPEHRSYFSLAAFSDPDGNSWVLQEITTRLPGRVGGGATAFDSATELCKLHWRFRDLLEHWSRVLTLGLRVTDQFCPLPFSGFGFQPRIETGPVPPTRRPRRRLRRFWRLFGKR